MSRHAHINIFVGLPLLISAADNTRDRSWLTTEFEAVVETYGLHTVIEAFSDGCLVDGHMPMQCHMISMNDFT